MREHHLQTPLKELGNRRSKSISADQTKKPLKTTRKNLNPAFESHAASFPELSPKESITISDDHNHLTEDLLFIPETPSSEAVDSLADLTPMSSTVTSDWFKECTGSNSRGGIPQQMTDVKFGFVEAELAVKYLREAQMQVVNAADIDIRYKKLLDAVMNTVVEEFYGLPEDKDLYNTLVSKKFHLVTLTFLLWIIAVFIGFFFRLGEKHSFHGTLPT